MHNPLPSLNNKYSDMHTHWNRDINTFTLFSKSAKKDPRWYYFHPGAILCVVATWNIEPISILLLGAIHWFCSLWAQYAIPQIIDPILNLGRQCCTSKSTATHTRYKYQIEALSTQKSIYTNHIHTTHHMTILLIQKLGKQKRLGDMSILHVDAPSLHGGDAVLQLLIAVVISHVGTAYVSVFFGYGRA